MTTAALLDDQKLVDDASEYISNFLATRFENLPPDWHVALAEYGLEMFQSGAAWADATAGRVEKPAIIMSAANRCG